LDTSDLEYTNTYTNVQWPMSVVHSLVPKVIAMWMCIWCSPFTKLWVLQCLFLHKLGCVQTQALLTSSFVATENLHCTVYHSLLWAVIVGKWPSNQQCLQLCWHFVWNKLGGSVWHRRNLKIVLNKIILFQFLYGTRVCLK
jgi:hypothetical protein